MNYFGSYTRLVRNSVSAMMAAIEIYHKPAFEYRAETFCVLLFNAWELILKAILSKNHRSIYQKKEREKPYQTLGWTEAFRKAQAFFPKDISVLELAKNLELLSTYRNSTVHFYNEPGFESLIHALAQAAVMNFADLLKRHFNIDLGAELKFAPLPLGATPPIDALTFISQAKPAKTRRAVAQFLAQFARAQQEVVSAKGDTSRLLIVYRVKMESTKKVQNADIVVGVTGQDDGSGPLAIERKIDPNKSHPLRRKDVLKEIVGKTGQRIGPYQFDAIIRTRGLKENEQYCWSATEGVLVKYSRDILSYLFALSDTDISAAVQEYKKRQRAAVK